MNWQKRKDGVYTIVDHGRDFDLMAFVWQDVWQDGDGSRYVGDLHANLDANTWRRAVMADGESEEIVLAKLTRDFVELINKWHAIAADLPTLEAA